MILTRLLKVYFGFVFSLIIVSSAFASPTTVRLEVGGLGIDDGNPASPFNLPVASELISGQAYKILITGKDNDGDTNNQPVNNITFDIAIASGTLTGFDWLVTGDIDDGDYTNSIPGVDNPGQVSTDTFSGHQLPTQVLIDAGLASPLPLAVIYFTAGQPGFNVQINLDSNPYVSGFATDNSHYGVNGVSYNINQGQGLTFLTSIGSGGSPTPTQTSTRTPTAFATFTHTRTPTLTATRTSTATATLTAVSTATRTATPTNTSIPPTVTNTRTPTHTTTLIPSLTRTSTATPTASTAPPTLTHTRTSTPTAISTSTFTRTPTLTATRTATATLTAVSTATYTATPTSSTAPPTFTRTPTSTNTPIVTGTFTPSRTATQSPSRTITPTSAASPTRTATPTISATATITQTPTVTLTATVTPTPTPTQSRTHTPTPLPTRSATITPLPEFSISGKVSLLGSALKGVTIDGGTLGVTVTDRNGAYLFTNVAYGSSYTLIASKNGFVFTPASSCGSVTANIIRDFKALSQDKVYPRLECVQSNLDGSRRAVFGYESTFTSPVNIAAGNKNKFIPNPKDRGQPAIFNPGRFSNVIATNFTGNNLTWKVDGISAVASSTLISCCGVAIDQCGVCGGDGSSCQSCVGASSSDVLSQLSRLALEEEALVKRIEEGYQKALRGRILAPAPSRSLVSLTDSAFENRTLLQALGTYLQECSLTQSCGSTTLCNLVSQYAERSKNMVLSAKLFERHLKSQLDRIKGTRRFQISVFTEAHALDERTQRVLQMIPSQEGLCGE